MRISKYFGNPIESQHMNPHFRIRRCGGSVIYHAAFSAQVVGQLASSPDAVVPEVATFNPDGVVCESVRSIAEVQLGIPT